jgi:serine/threonine protein kinase
VSSPGGQRPDRKREVMPPRLGRYEVRAKIGEGGMATVYVGRDAERVVALKVIKEEYSLNREFVNMFLDEAKIVSALKHPNLIDVYELGSEGPRLFIAMELLRGQSLWHVWMACRDRRVRLPYDLAAWMGARVAEGLHHAHEVNDEAGRPLGVVHRDVNASNIFITYDGQVKMIDFGLAKGANRVSKTAAGVVKGKFAYMSPEQALGKPIDRRTDVFALAVTLWEVTVDRRLFKGKDDFETLRKVSQGAVRDPRELVVGYPPELARILKRALERDRTKRFSSALDMSRALDSFAKGEGRTIGEARMGAVMRALFASAWQREKEWLAEASAADRPAPKESLRPPSTAGDEAEAAPEPERARPTPQSIPPYSSTAPEGLFLPAAIRPPPNPNQARIHEEVELETIDPAAESAAERRSRIKRVALMGLGTVVILALAMLIGALWGQRSGRR